MLGIPNLRQGPCPSTALFKPRRSNVVACSPSVPHFQIQDLLQDMPTCLESLTLSSMMQNLQVSSSFSQNKVRFSTCFLQWFSLELLLVPSTLQWSYQDFPMMPTLQYHVTIVYVQYTCIMYQVSPKVILAQISQYFFQALSPGSSPILKRLESELYLFLQVSFRPFPVSVYSSVRLGYSQFTGLEGIMYQLIGSPAQGLGHHICPKQGGCSHPSMPIYFHNLCRAEEKDLFAPEHLEHTHAIHEIHYTLQSNSSIRPHIRKIF